MKNIDKTILNGKQINDYEQDYANDVRMDAEDEADEEDNPYIEGDGEEEAEKIDKFGKLSEKLNLKSYKVGVGNAYGIYQDLSKNGDLKDLKNKVFDSSKKTYQKLSQEQAKRNKELQKERTHNQKIIDKLAKKSLSHTYRKAYLDHAFKNIYYQQDKDLDTLHNKSKELDNDFKGKEYDTKYIHNYIADYLRPSAEDHFNFMHTGKSHHYMPLKDFKKYLKNVQPSYTGADFYDNNIEVAKITDEIANKTDMVNELGNTKNFNNARKQFGYMNTEPLSKLKKQLNHRRKLNNNPNILTPDQIDKKGGQYWAKAIDLNDKTNQPRWNKVSDFAQSSKYTKHPLYLYKGDMDYAKQEINGLSKNPSQHEIFNMKQRIFVHSKLNYLKENSPKRFKSLKNKMFTPKEMKQYTNQQEQINRKYNKLDKLMFNNVSSDNKNYITSNTENMLGVYDDDIISIKNAYESASLDGEMPTNKDYDRKEQAGKAVDKSVKKWLPLLNKDDQKEIKQSRNEDLDYGQYTSDEARQAMDNLGTKLPKMHDKELEVASNKFFQKGVDRLNHSHKIPKSIANIKQFNHNHITKHSHNHNFTTNQQNTFNNVQPKVINRQRTNNRNNRKRDLGITK